MYDAYRGRSLTTAFGRRPVPFGEFHSTERLPAINRFPLKPPTRCPGPPGYTECIRPESRFGMERDTTRLRSSRQERRVLSLYGRRVPTVELLRAPSSHGSRTASRPPYSNLPNSRPPTTMKFTNHYPVIRSGKLSSPRIDQSMLSHASTGVVTPGKFTEERAPTCSTNAGSPSDLFSPVNRAVPVDDSPCQESAIISPIPERVLIPPLDFSLLNRLPVVEKDSLELLLPVDMELESSSQFVPIGKADSLDASRAHELGDMIDSMLSDMSRMVDECLISPSRPQRRKKLTKHGH